MKLTHLGTHDSGIKAASAAEIVAYAPSRRALYVVNGHARAIDILDIADPSQPRVAGRIETGPLGGAINSVAVKGSRIAAALEAADRQAAGCAAFFDLAGALERTIPVGAQPDMLAFTPSGETLLIANEGEPSDDYARDPRGSVSLIDMKTFSVRTIGFAGVRAAGLHRPSPPGTSLARDIEPEFIAVTPSGRLAFVSLQEANAIAVIDIVAARLVRVFALGERAMGGGRPDAVLTGLYQPDGIAAFEEKGRAYVASANEGDARKTSAYRETVRLEDAALDPALERFLSRRMKKKHLRRLQRLKLSRAASDTDGDGDLDRLAGLGTRSFSIWDEHGARIYDSGDEFDRRLAAFSIEEPERDKPEAITIGMAGGRRLLFTAMEVSGVILAYDISLPAAPCFLTAAHRQGDEGPEGLLFIAAEDSPTGTPLLVAANEVSGTTTIYEVSL